MFKDRRFRWQKFIDPKSVSEFDVDSILKARFAVENLGQSHQFTESFGAEIDLCENSLKRSLDETLHSPDDEGGDKKRLIAQVEGDPEGRDQIFGGSVNVSGFGS